MSQRVTKVRKPTQRQKPNNPPGPKGVKKGPVGPDANPPVPADIKIHLFLRDRATGDIENLTGTTPIPCPRLADYSLNLMHALHWAELPLHRLLATHDLTWNRGVVSVAVRARGLHKEHDLPTLRSQSVLLDVPFWPGIPEFDATAINSKHAKFVVSSGIVEIVMVHGAAPEFGPHPPLNPPRNLGSIPHRALTYGPATRLRAQNVDNPPSPMADPPSPSRLNSPFRPERRKPRNNTPPGQL